MSGAACNPVRKKQVRAKTRGSGRGGPVVYRCSRLGGQHVRMRPVPTGAVAVVVTDTSCARPVPVAGHRTPLSLPLPVARFFMQAASTGAIKIMGFFGQHQGIKKKWQ